MMAWYTEDDPQTYNELERCVEPFLQALSPEMAEMLLAIDIEGVSQKEYARTKGLAYSTMKSRVAEGAVELTGAVRRLLSHVVRCKRKHYRLSF